MGGSPVLSLVTAGQCGEADPLTGIPLVFGELQIRGSPALERFPSDLPGFSRR
jgi:hypothetical protein